MKMQFIIGISLVVLGFVGIIGSLIWPFLLLPFMPRSKKTHEKIVPSLSLFVIAHNEEAQIAITLSAINAALSEIPCAAGEVTKTVLLDRCRDRTGALAQAFDFEALAIDAGSKWRAILHAIRHADKEWIGLIDAGIFWEKDLLANLYPALSDGGIMGIAPRYRSIAGSVISRLYWGFEVLCKSIESRYGGPISVHGATVFYRRSFLLAHMEKLEGTQWYNDDIIIPLLLRLHHPHHQIVYGSFSGKALQVTDFGLRSKAKERRARNRMMVGNIQWISAILIPGFKMSPTVGLISLRRAARVFASYWILAIVLGTLFLGAGSWQDGAEWRWWALGATCFMVFSAFLWFPGARSSFAALSAMRLRKTQADW